MQVLRITQGLSAAVILSGDDTAGVEELLRSWKRWLSRDDPHALVMNPTRAHRFYPLITGLYPIPASTPRI